MTIVQIAFISVAFISVASAAGAVNSPAGTGLVLHTTAGALAGEKSAVESSVSEVRPGDVFTITGDCVKTDDLAAGLRVVLTLTDALASARPGFHAVLPTDQQIRGDSLRVRVPDMPETSNRVFDVQVFRLGTDVPQICNAGAIRIGSAGNGKVG